MKKENATPFTSTHLFGPPFFASLVKANRFLLWLANPLLEQELAVLKIASFSKLSSMKSIPQGLCERQRNCQRHNGQQDHQDGGCERHMAGTLDR
jgi:hypothetical protein